MQQDIIKETLESMHDYVPKLVTASEQIAHDIQTHQAGWIDTLLAYLDGVAWLLSAVYGVQRLDSKVLGNGDLEQMISTFDQMRAALEEQDFVSLCDLIQYEMLPILQTYDNELKGMIQ